MPAHFSSIKKWFFLSVPIIFILGSLLHFLFDLSAGNRFIALFAPVNESVWEHLKLPLLPTITVYSAFFFAFHKKFSISTKSWFCSLLFSLISMMLSIIFLFYSYSQALGFESVFVDIAIFFVAVLIGQMLGLHLFRFCKGLPLPFSIFALLSVFTIFALFTFFPPDLPIFFDKSSSLSGIQ